MNEEAGMFCPGCGGEYRPGFQRCADCELDLVPELPPFLTPVPELPPSLGPVDPSALVTVVATGDRCLLAQAKSLLAGAGISCVALGEEPHAALDRGGLPPGFRADPMEIQVEARHWREAGALLARAGLEPVEATPEEQLAEGTPEGEEASGTPAPALPIPRAERRQRGWELTLVLLVAFSSPLFYSTWSWWTGRVGPVVDTVLGDVYGLQRHAIGLALLAYVLGRRGRTFRDLGLLFSWADLPLALLLTVAAFLVERAAWRILDWAAVVATGRPMASAHSHDPVHLAGLALITLALLSDVIGPFFEEMIARAYTLTEVEALTGSTRLAIAASVALQTSYHFYQGTAHALATGASFLVYSSFYARFRRITPVILAHALWDVMVTLRQL